MMSHKSIRLGIIGLGHIADYQLSALNYLEGFDLVALCDKDRSKKAKVPGEQRFYDNSEQFFNDRLMDVALISVPHSSHLKITKIALDSGVHVLIEKPLVSNSDELTVLSKLDEKFPGRVHSALHASFGAEVEWLLNNEKVIDKLELGQLVGFHCGFYDPYIEEGELKKSVAQLGGSWIDSAINALSVVGKFISPERLTLTNHSRSTIESINCSEIQGMGTYSIQENGKKTGIGVVDTSWVTGKDQKRTQLYYQNGSILLDHSNQSVVHIKSNGESVQLADFSSEHERLTRHYIGLYKSFRNDYLSGRSNYSHSARLHDLMFSFYSSS